MYAKPVAAVYHDLENYVLKGATHTFLAPDKTSNEKVVFPTHAVTGFESTLMTANLLASLTGREADARAIFDALARDHADDLSLTESRAYFELRRGRLADALPYFARAVELGSKNLVLYRDYATRVASFDSAKAETLFQTALSLDPDDVESRLAYGDLLMRRGRPADALAAVSPITHVPADHAFALFRLKAASAAQLGRFEEARGDVARALQYAHTPQDASYATQFLKAIDGALDRRTTADTAPVDLAVVTGAGGNTATPPTAPSDDAARGQLRTPASETRDRRGTHQESRVRRRQSGARSPHGRRHAAPRDRQSACDSSPRCWRHQHDLSCGPEDRHVHVGYDPVANTTLHTTGNVRQLDFR